MNATVNAGYLLDKNSYIWAWGNSTNLNTGTGLSCSTPVQGIADKTYARLCEGTIALDASSYAWAWGDNAYGTVGNGMMFSPTGVLQSVVGGIRWRDIQGQYQNRWGLDISSYAWAWGSNNVGSCGDNTIPNRSSPVSVVGDKQFISISGGCVGNGGFCVGLDSSSYAWAWGYNGSGYLGNNTVSNSSSPISVVGNKQWRIILSTQSAHATEGCVIALDSSSYAWAWGTDTYGQAGVAAMAASSPISVHGPWDNIYHLSGLSFLGVSNGASYVWGRNNYGQLGINSTTDVFSPTLVQYPFTIKKIVGGRGASVGESTTYAIDTNDTLWSWGYNNNGQLGNNTINHLSYPARPSFYNKRYNSYTYPHPNITNNNLHLGGSAATTNLGYLFLDDSSYAWTWGVSLFGHLGNGTNLGIRSPQSVVGNIRFKQIAMTSATTGVDISGYGWAWGYNGSAALGDNTIIDKSSPVSVIGNKKWIKILNTLNNGVGLDESSYVWAWGLNTSGQLGNNSITNTSSPVSVVGGRQALDIKIALDNRIIMLDSSSYAWTWGATIGGGLGDNATGNRSSPVSVVGNRQFTKIAATANNCFGLDSSSYLWAWGNAPNQLGDNTNIPKSSPVSVVGDRQFVTLGDNLTTSSWMFAIDASSYAWAWGTGSSGSGDGTSVSRSSPVSVIGGYQFTRIISNQTLTTIGITSTGAMAWGQVGNNGNNICAAGTLATANALDIYPGQHTYIVSPVIVKKNIFGQ